MNQYDLIIVGSGPAGMTAAIYAGRAELKTLLLEQNPMGGGQIVNTYEVDNYPGLPGINGFDLGTRMSEHVDRFEVDRKEAVVLSVDLAGEEKKVVTDEGTFTGRAVLITSGNSLRKLGVPGEEELGGMGVSYCATCDGAFFRGKVTAVIGGGDVAVEDAIFLSRGCKKVYLVHRRDELRAAKTLQTALFARDNVEMVWDSVVEKISGSDHVESMTVKNVKTQETGELSVDGVFVAVGTQPNNGFYMNAGLELDQAGYIVAGEDCRSSIKRVYAAGDVRTKRLRQVSTAVGDGANAVSSILEDLL
ncbi:MAG: thioredoxin-disulfide reductase [Lachnospiraceae bacterium]|nr:thioredoxin-disulfide reductase [Lachnospiraceae bacterium]